MYRYPIQGSAGTIGENILMKIFDLKIGFKCNNNCRHCVVANKRSAGDMPLEKLLGIIKSLDVDQVTVTGGEPSTYEYLPIILSEIKKKQIATVVQTNGTGFSDKKFCEECAKYMDHAHVAIHSSDPEIHDNIVQSKGMWEKTMKGWENLRNCGVFCTTQTVLSKFNIDSLYNTYTLIQDIAPGTIMSMTYPHLMGNALNNVDEIAFRYSDHKDMIQKCLKTFGEFLFVESIPPCYLYPYQNKIIGSLENDIMEGFTDRKGVDFSDGYFNKNYNELDVSERRKAPKCKECVFNEICIGVWKEYISYFKKQLDLYPIKEMCNDCC